MARYSRNTYGNPKGRSSGWLYIILALIVVTAAFAFVFKYNPFRMIRENQPPSETQGKKEETSKKVEEPVKKPEPAVVEPPPPPPVIIVENEPAVPVDLNPEVTRLIKDANDLLDAKPQKIIQARTILNDAFKMPMTEQRRNQVRQILTDLSEKWLFSRTIYPDDTLCGTYKVEPGDRLSTIAKKYKIPWEGLMDINKISRPEALNAGQTIKVVNGPFHARVYRTTYTMDLYLQEVYVRSFHVGLGMNKSETPTGVWKTAEGGKLVTPTWTSPEGKVYHAEDPNYPLGSRWIGLEGVSGNAKDRKGFAIHGTKDSESIGQNSSLGCIRLHNGEVIMVYNLLEPGYSFVYVLE